MASPMPLPPPVTKTARLARLGKCANPLAWSAGAGGKGLARWDMAGRSGGWLGGNTNKGRPHCASTRPPASRAAARGLAFRQPALAAAPGGSVGFQMQASFTLERRPHLVPVHARFLRNVAQGQHHAFFHVPETADIKVTALIAQQGGQV